MYNTNDLTVDLKHKHQAVSKTYKTISLFLLIFQIICIQNEKIYYFLIHMRQEHSLDSRNDSVLNLNRTMTFSRQFSFKHSKQLHILYISISQ